MYPGVVTTATGAPEGLRARKRRETRQRIADAGLRLFLSNGFDETTLDMIADAADISRRTFFHYFESKDAVLETWVRELEVLVGAAIGQATWTTPLDVVYQGLARLASQYETAEALSIDHLMRSTEALRVRKQANYERLERSVTAALEQRCPDPAQHSVLRLAALVGIGTLRLALENWGADGHRGPVIGYLDDAFVLLPSALTR
jgi:AcrR family transcriptional regulator